MAEAIPYRFFSVVSEYNETYGWFWNDIDKDYGKVMFPYSITEDEIIDFMVNSGHTTDRASLFIDWHTETHIPLIEVLDKNDGRPLFVFHSNLKQRIRP